MSTSAAKDQEQNFSSDSEPGELSFRLNIFNLDKGDAEPSGYGMKTRLLKKTQPLSFSLFTSFCDTGNDGAWRKTVDKDKFESLLEGMEGVIKGMDLSKIEGSNFEIKDKDLIRYCKLTWHDCWLRSSEFFQRTRKLKEKLFVSRFYLLREYEGLTIKRDIYSDNSVAKESAKRYERFQNSCQEGKINLIQVINVLKEMVTHQEKLPKCALAACMRLEGALLWTEPPVISLPIALFHPYILQRSIIGLQLCNPLTMSLCENFPPAGRMIRSGYSGSQLYNRLLVWPEAHAKLLNMAFYMSGCHKIFRGAPHTLPSDQILYCSKKRKTSTPIREAKRQKL